MELYNCLDLNYNLVMTILLQRSSWAEYIYVDGCIDAFNKWVNANMIPVAATAVGVAVIEVSRLLTILTRLACVFL